MKRRVLIVLSILLSITGCYWTPEEELVGLTSFPEIPDLGLQTVEDVMLWTAFNIDYVSDAIHYPADWYWQSPAQTYVWGTGDCEDYSILAMYLVYRDVGIKSKLAIGELESPGNIHAWVQVGIEWWEPQNGLNVTGDPRYTLLQLIGYDEVIERSTTTHRAIR